MDVWFYEPDYLRDDKRTGEVMLFVRHVFEKPTKRGPRVMCVRDVETFPSDEEMVASIDARQMREAATDADAIALARSAPRGKEGA